MDREAAAKPHSWLRYVLVWVCLLALTSGSFLASRAHLGSLDVVIGLGIACAKTLLVLLFFMHLLEHRLSNAMVVIAAFAFVALLTSLLVADVVTRRTFPPAPFPVVEPGSS